MLDICCIFFHYLLFWKRAKKLFWCKIANCCGRSSFQQNQFSILCNFFHSIEWASTSKYQNSHFFFSFYFLTLRFFLVYIFIASFHLYFPFKFCSFINSPLIHSLSLDCLFVYFLSLLLSYLWVSRKIVFTVFNFQPFVKKSAQNVPEW